MKKLIYLIIFILMVGLTQATVITDCTELQAMTINGIHELGNDIDCTGFDFTPIASPFSGILDGKGFDILNLNVNVTGTAALFERCQNSGYDFIHNFTMTNPYIESSTSIAGAVCGNVFTPDYVNDITVYNGTVKGASNTGGICSSNCYLKNVHYNGYVSTTNNNVGGLLGLASTAGVTVTNCSSTGTVESFDLSASEVGGLVADMSTSKVHVYSSWSNATVIGLTDHVGGITGQSLNPDSSIENSYFTGHISAPSESGGIQGVGTGLILNSYANATFSGALITELGGIIGHDSGLLDLNVTNSFAISNLTGTNGLIMGRCQSNGCNIDGNYAYNDTQNTDYIVVSGTYTGTNYPITTQSYFTDTTNPPMSSWSANIWGNAREGITGFLPCLLWEDGCTSVTVVPPNITSTSIDIKGVDYLTVSCTATDDKAVTSYTISINGTDETKSGLSTCETTFINLEAGTTYNVSFTAFDEGGLSDTKYNVTSTVNGANKDWIPQGNILLKWVYEIKQAWKIQAKKYYTVSDDGLSEMQLKYNGENFSFTNNNTKNYTFDNVVIADTPWTNNFNYPTACPSYSAVTENGDSNICTDSWVHRDGDTMTGDLSMGGNAITNVKYIDFNLTPEISAHQQGRMHWDTDDKTLAIDMGISDVELQVGQENLIYVTNKAGYDMYNGQVVYITGAQGNRPTVELADKRDSDKLNVAGILTTDLADNANGYVTINGLVRDIDASGTPYGETWLEGDKLYLNTGGNMSNLHPSSSTDGVVIVATVIRPHAVVGQILVTSPEPFTIGNNYNGILRQSVINKNTGTNAAAGFTAVNDLNHFTTMGIAGSNNAIFPNEVSIYYSPGYGDHWQAVDGDKDFVWFTDPTDSHDNSALDHEVMRLSSEGDLSIRENLSTPTLHSYSENVRDSDTLFEVISDTRGTPQFMVQDGGPAQASFITRSFLVVNQNNTLLNSSQNNNCSDWGFIHLDCNTATTGADFGVTDDAEIIGALYADEGLRAHSSEYGSYLVLGDRQGLYKGYNGSYDYENNIFCDYVANNFNENGSLSQWLVIQEESVEFTEARADVGGFINSSCIFLEHNPAWDKDFNTSYWGMKTGLNMVSQKGGFFEYYVGDDEQSGFKIKNNNATAFSTVYIDDIAGDDQHQALTLDYEMGNYEGQVGMNLIMKKGDEQIVNKDLTMLLLEGEATNMNNSRGVFIDMEVIGQPLTLEGSIDGIHMPPNMNNLIKVGSPDTISRAYSNEVDITADVLDSTSTAAVFNNDNDVVYVGDTLNFTTMGFVLDTESNRNVLLNYYYCDTAGTWQTLTGVTDSTNGFQVGGTITFNNPSDRGVCNEELDGTPFANTTNYAYIALERTRNNVGTTPVIETASISGVSTNMFLQEDLLRLAPVDTAPATCSASNLGAIYFDVSEDDMCQCASGGWEVIRDGSACT